jgi:hypothetical protein
VKADGIPAVETTQQCVNFVVVGLNETPVLQQPFHFAIEARDGAEKLFKLPPEWKATQEMIAKIEDPNGNVEDVELSEDKSGYKGSCQMDEPGTYQLHVRVSSQPITGSPFSITAKAPVDPSKCTASGPDVVAPNAVTEFKVVVRFGRCLIVMLIL